MKRVIISLDPEYIPWQGEVVKLRKQRSKWTAVSSILFSLLAIVAVGGYWWYTNARPVDAGTTEATPTASVPEDDIVSPTPGGTDGIVEVGIEKEMLIPGQLTLKSGLSYSFIPCGTYRLLVDGTVVGAGVTADVGAGVDVTGYVTYTLECDGIVHLLGE